MLSHYDSRILCLLASAFWKCSIAADIDISSLSCYNTITIPSKLPATLTADDFTFTISSTPSSVSTSTYAAAVVYPGSPIIQEEVVEVVYSGSFILIPATGGFCEIGFRLFFINLRL